MSLVDPAELLAVVDQQRFRRLCGDSSVELQAEPRFAEVQTSAAKPQKAAASYEARPPETIRGGIQRFADGIDTDLISPSATLARSATATREELQQMCFEYSRPDFAEQCLKGRNIVVAVREA